MDRNSAITKMLTKMLQNVLQKCSTTKHLLKRILFERISLGLTGLIEILFDTCCFPTRFDDLSPVLSF